MIRREQLAASVANDSPDVAGEAADRVKRGEAVRIVGLGTLARVYAYTGGSDGNYRFRLTLTATAAKACGDSDWTHVACGRASVADARSDVHHDVRHLARALGAPVEVWAPEAAYRGMAEHKGPRLITTVQP